MKKKAKDFCRIIELPQTQCLLKVEYEDEDDSFYVRITFSIKGCFATVGYGFKEEKKADQLLKDFTIEQATQLYNNNVKLLS